MSSCPLIKGIKNKATIDTVHKYTYSWTVNKIIFADKSTWKWTVYYLFH